MSSCKPENRFIRLDNTHQVQVVVEGEQQRYIPLVWVDNPGSYVPLLPEGKVRLTLLEATNDCRLHAGLKAV